MPCKTFAVLGQLPFWDFCLSVTIAVLRLLPFCDNCRFETFAFLWQLPFCDNCRFETFAFLWQLPFCDFCPHVTFAILGHLPFILVHDLRDLADWISWPGNASFAVLPLVTKKSLVTGITGKNLLYWPFTGRWWYTRTEAACYVVWCYDNKVGHLGSPCQACHVCQN